VKKLRTMIVAALAASTLAIPVSAHANGGSCVGTSMQMTHTAIGSEARSGSLRDLIESFRTQPEQWPWCNG
jgi:hypothetical protein